MAQDDRPKQPEARNILEFRFDPQTGVLRPRELPTIPSRYSSGIFPTWDVNRPVGNSGYTVSGTAPLMVTRLSLMATSCDYCFISVADRGGTIDTFVLGTAAALGNDKRTQVTLLGGPDNPVMVFQGTPNIYNAGGSLGAGSFSVSYEGIRSMTIN